MLRRKPKFRTSNGYSFANKPSTKRGAIDYLKRFMKMINKPFHLLADFLENLHVVKILHALSSIILIITLATFYYTMIDMGEENTLESWQLANDKSTDDYFLKRSLEYLNSEKCILGDLCWKERVAMPIDFTKREGILALDGAYLSHADFMFAKFPRTDFSNSILTGAVFGQTFLESVNFSNSKLQNANYIDTTLSASTFERTDLTGSDFEIAEISSTKFIDSNLTLATFEGAELSKVSFQGSELRGGSFSEAFIEQSKFHRTYLEGASFKDSELLEVTFFGTKFTDVDLSNAVLKDVVIVYSNKEQFFRTNFKEADIRGITIVDKKFWRKRDNSWKDKVNDPSNIAAVCELLSKAKNWSLAYRDEKYACGANIPQISKDELG